VSRTAATVIGALVVAALGAFTTPAAAAPAPAPGQAPEVAACYDGTCTLTVTGPVKIPLDGRAGFTSLSVAHIGPYAVTFAVHRATSGVGIGVVGQGGTTTFGSGTGTLAVQVLELGQGTAQLEITTTVP
jgi:hypothetical protein